MRIAHFDKNFIFDESTVVGISLGYDHCAEHEWGVKELKTLLGYRQPEFPMGVEDRIIPALSPDKARAVYFGVHKHRIAARPGSNKKTETVQSATLCVSAILAEVSLEAESLSQLEQLIKAGKAPWHAQGAYEMVKAPALLYDLKHPTPRCPIDYDSLDNLVAPSEKESRISVPQDKFIQAAWNSSEFKVTVWGNARVQALNGLYEALLAGRCTLSLSGSQNPFAGAGLCLTDASLISEGVKAKVLADDIAHKALMDDVAASGIVQYLKEHGKKYFALSPRYDEKGQLVFFLNPQQQDANNFGWFTVEDLKAWVRGEGPIPKSAAKTTAG